MIFQAAVGVWPERFFWIHITGLAVLPITLGLCVLGLAVGDPVLPAWLELTWSAVLAHRDSTVDAVAAALLHLQYFGDRTAPRTAKA